MPNIIVCMKIIIDPEMPFSMFNIDREHKRPVPPSGLPPVFSPFDENALEAALRIKDSQDCKVTVLSLGKTLPKALLQKALAVGVNEAFAVEDPAFENLDPFSTAQVMANAIKKIGEYDLIFTGRQPGRKRPKLPFQAHQACQRTQGRQTEHPHRPSRSPFDARRRLLYFHNVPSLCYHLCVGLVFRPATTSPDQELFCE